MYMERTRNARSLPWAPRCARCLSNTPVMCLANIRRRNVDGTSYSTSRPIFAANRLHHVSRFTDERLFPSRVRVMPVLTEETNRPLNIYTVKYSPSPGIYALTYMQYQNGRALSCLSTIIVRLFYPPGAIYPSSHGALRVIF